MEPARFNTSTFSGRTGYVDDIVRRFTPEHLFHYHVTEHQGNERLSYWARHAIRNSERPVLLIDQGGNRTLLREEELPDSDTKYYPYAISGDGLRIRLDKLPTRYDHLRAVDGGLGEDYEFVHPFNELNGRLNRQLLDKKLPDNDSVRDFLNDPSIMAGAYWSVFPDGITWQKIVYYGMHQLGIWHNDFHYLAYNMVDNCIESFPAEFDLSRLVPVILEFGGWLDFSPGNRQGSKTSITCNFTTSGRDSKGLQAIVFSASTGRGNLTTSQQQFIDAVAEGFGVN